MKTVAFPYGKEKLSYTFGDELCAVLLHHLGEVLTEGRNLLAILERIFNQAKQALE